MTDDIDLRKAVKERLQAGGWIDVAGHSPEDEWDAVAERAIEAVMGADLRRRELEAIVHDLGAIDEPDVIDDRGVRMCGLCGGGPGEDEWEKPQDDAHYDNCPWRRARELMGDSSG